MSWNEMLYAYQKEKGGVFMGSRAADWDGELVLSCRDEPLIIRTVGESNGRYTTTSIRVRLAIHLERDYELRIRPKSAMSTGLNTVLGVLDRGLEKLPSGPDLHEDYGCPEVTRGRTITTTDRSFTKLVLGDLALRNALAMREKDSIQVGEAPQSGGWHRIEVNAGDVFGTIGGASPWINEAMAADTLYMDPEDKEALLQAGSRCFNTQMDGFLGLLRAARDGVTMWPMPKTT